MASVEDTTNCEDGTEHGASEVDLNPDFREQHEALDNPEIFGLPDEIIIKILRNLDLVSVLRSAETCRRLHRSVNTSQCYLYYKTMNI